jgi:hypothetical protein
VLKKEGSVGASRRLAALKREVVSRETSLADHVNVTVRPMIYAMPIRKQLAGGKSGGK